MILAWTSLAWAATVTWQPQTPLWRRLDGVGTFVVPSSQGDELLVRDVFELMAVRFDADLNVVGMRPLGEGNAEPAAWYDFDGDGIDDLYLVDDDRMQVRSGVDGRELAGGRFNAQVVLAEELTLADLDGDGLYAVASTHTDLVVLDVWGNVVASTPAARRGSVVAQLDDDPALEIVASDGRILEGSALRADGDTNLPFDQGCVADVDADGHDEAMFVSQSLRVLWDPDVGTRWSHWGRDDVPCTFGDFDGDGALEVATEGARYLLRSFDVETGAAEAFTVFESGYCDRLTRFDPDGDGVDAVLCGDNARDYELIDLSAGRSSRYGHPGAHDKPPLVIDLDGDGRREQVWGGVDVQDPLTGEVFDRVPVRGGSWSAAGDVDGDGVGEILDGYDDLVVYRWSRSGPLTELFRFPSTTRFTDMQVIALNGPGSNVLFHDEDQFLDFGSGFVSRSARRIGEEAVWIEADGVPPMEAMVESGTPWVPALVDADGWSRATFRRGVVPIVHGGRVWFATQVGDTVELAEVVPGVYGAQVVRTVPIPGNPQALQWAGGRLWLRYAQRTDGWSPFDDTIWRFPAVGDDVWVVDDVVWFNTADDLQAWRLPFAP